MTLDLPRPIISDAGPGDNLIEAGGGFVFQFIELICLIDIDFIVLQLNFHFVISLFSQMEVLDTQVFYYLFIPFQGANV